MIPVANATAKRAIPISVEIVVPRRTTDISPSGVALMFDFIISSTSLGRDEASRFPCFPKSLKAKPVNRSKRPRRGPLTFAGRAVVVVLVVAGALFHQIVTLSLISQFEGTPLLSSSAPAVWSKSGTPQRDSSESLGHS